MSKKRSKKEDMNNTTLEKLKIIHTFLDIIKLFLSVIKEIIK